MKNYRQSIKFEEVRSKDIAASADFLLGFETEESNEPFLLFFHNKGKYYPVVRKDAALQAKTACKSIRAMVAEDMEEIINLLLGIKGINKFNFVEKLLILRHAGDSKKISAPFLNLNKYLPLLKLPQAALMLLAKNRLSPDLGLKIIALSRPDSTFFLKLIEDFQLNINQQREVFSHLADISKIHKKPFVELLNLTRFAGIKNPSQKTEAVLDCMREAGMPEFYKTLEQFNNLKNKLNLPGKINLVEPPYFESKTLKLEIFFKSYDELVKKINALTSNVKTNDAVWREIFSCI